MARTPDGLQARTERVTVRVTKNDLAKIDRERGKLGRAEWVRRQALGIQPKRKES